MKKAVFLALLAVFLGGSLWAVDFSMSAGAGGLFGGFFTRYKSSNSSGSGRMTQNVNQVIYGGLIFLDATYGEFAFTVQGGYNNYDEVMSKNGAFAARTGNGWETMLGINVNGKYPIALADRLILFPLLGLEYRIALSERRRESGGLIYDRTNGLQEQDIDGKAFDISSWNSFWIHLGLGGDFAILKDLFLRGELLYGFRLMSAYEKDGLEQAKAILGDNDPRLQGLTSGPCLRLCVGYRFLNG